jgi:hypothetical protein
LEPIGKVNNAPQPRSFRLGAWGHKGDAVGPEGADWYRFGVFMFFPSFGLLAFELQGEKNSSMKNISGIPWFSTTFSRIHSPESCKSAFPTS